MSIFNNQTALAIRNFQHEETYMRRPALWTALLFVLGIWVSYFVHVPVLFWWIGTTGCLAAGSIAWMRRRSEHLAGQVLFALMVFMAGAFRYAGVTQDPPENHLSLFPDFGEQVALSGRVSDEPDVFAEKIRLTLESREVAWEGNWAEVRGRVLVTVKEGADDLGFGDLVTVHGRLRRPAPARNPGAFDYRKYLGRRGISALLSVRKRESIQRLEKGEARSFFSGGILPIRRSIRSTVDRNLLGAPAALLKGLLLGEKHALPKEVRAAFNRVGVSHVLAVSGLHVGLIAGIFFFVFRLLGLTRSRATWVTVGALIVYVFVVDKPPSVVRASVMAGLILFAFTIERDADLWNVLGVAALVILLIGPQRLFDLWMQWGVAAIVVCAAAQIGTGPFVALYFNRLPLLSVAANLIVVPAIGIIVTLGLLASVFGFWLVPFATALNAVNWAFLSGLIGVVGALSEIPHTVLVTPSPAPVFFAGYYGAIALILWSRKSLPVRKALLFLALFGINVYIWKAVLREDRLEVVFLDVGQGDAVFLKFPNGRTMLVDGGARMPHFDAGKWVIAPFLRHKGIGKIDIVAPTHSDNDHIGGLVSILEEFPVEHVIDSGQYADSWTDDRFYELVEEKGIARHIVSAGDSLIGLGGVGAFVLHPVPKFVSQECDAPMGRNNTSVVLRITYGGTSLLLTGDAEKEAERFFINWGDRLPARVLKVGHHGSRGSSGRVFLDAVRPEIAILSVGAWNRFGHPAEEVLAKLREVGAQIYRTDRMGAVTMEVGEGWMKMRTMLPIESVKNEK
jgi:competence protein ComEC